MKKPGFKTGLILPLSMPILAIMQQEKVVFHLSHRESNAQLIEEDYAIYQYGLGACFTCITTLASAATLTRLY
ncbi:MAG: hypothetical protein R3B47_16400 [Bacteroidia bacterium]